MKRAPLLAVLLAGSAAASLFTPTIQSETTTDVENVEVRLGRLASGSYVASDGTNGTANVTGTKALLLPDALYLNNTNATGSWSAKLRLQSSTNVGNLVALSIGLKSGAISTPQIVGASGALTQTEGSLVPLSPGASATIFLGNDVTRLGEVSSFTLDVVLTREGNETTSIRYPVTLRVI